MATTGPDICIRLVGVNKSFAGVRVLRDITLDFRQGEIHGLVGENGAGKSTVGKIVGGYYSRSSGDLEIFGEKVGTTWDAATALSRGIAMMHQELQLVPELTVAQNVFLAIEHNRAGLLKGDENRRLADIVAVCGFDLDPSARAGSLSIADQQKIEIMRAMARDARVIVMDEPTSSLTADEAERLHATMRRLRSMGRTIIYVSHFLDHVLAVCDRVTIMREGAIVRTADAAGETKTTLVAGMLGRANAEVSYPEKSPRPTSGAAVLTVENLSGPTGIRDVSLEVRAGEIVGLIGLVGSGRSEIARAIFGADPSTAGRVTVEGADFSDRTPKRSVERGIAMVPEDRRKQGLVLTQAVRPNMTLPYLSTFAKGGFVDAAEEKSAVRRFIEHLGVSPRQVDGNVVTYSGGNQQKVLLAKWIMRDPKLVILDEPSRGVDLGARRRIHEFVGELARKGAAVLLISSEIEEVLGLCHRAYLVKGGRVTGEVDPDTVAMDKVLWQLFHDEGEPEPRRSVS